MSDNDPTPSSSEALPDDPELSQFEAVIETLQQFQSPLDLSWADGYLMAIAASRRFIPAEEWLPRLGGEAFERAYADPQSALEATTHLEMWLARRRRELDPLKLMDHPDQCFVTPLFDLWTDEDRARAAEAGELSAEDLASLQDGCLWANGFMEAVADFAEDWPDPAADDDSADAEGYRAMSDLIACLTQDPADPEVKAFFAAQWSAEPPTREQLLDEVCFAVQDLRLYWLDHPPKPVQRRVVQAPGRNDPCPCGSGLKYKKCHGAQA